CARPLWIYYYAMDYW
nr:immunoglobulin heavy chain junction region [Mus musculus]